MCLGGWLGWRAHRRGKFHGDFGGEGHCLLGAPAGGDGYFYPPTVLTSVPATARILPEEVFGPVAYAYTRDLNRGIRLSERVDVGMFGLNTGIVSNRATPFGGVKHSGLGREGGTEDIEEFLETRYVGIADPS